MNLKSTFTCLLFACVGYAAGAVMSITDGPTRATSPVRNSRRAPPGDDSGRDPFLRQNPPPVLNLRVRDEMDAECYKQDKAYKTSFDDRGKNVFEKYPLRLTNVDLSTELGRVAAGLVQCDYILDDFLLYLWMDSLPQTQNYVTRDSLRRFVDYILHGEDNKTQILLKPDRDPLAGWFTDEGEHSTRGCKTPLSILAHPYTVIAGTYQYLKVIEDQYKKTVTTIGFLFDIQLEFDPGQRISFTAQLSKFAQQRYGEAVKALESEMVRRNMVDLNFFRPGTSLGKQRNRNVPSVVKLPPTQRLRLLSAEEAANRTGSRVLPTLEA